MRVKPSHLTPIILISLLDLTLFSFLCYNQGNFYSSIPSLSFLSFVLTNLWLTSSIEFPVLVGTIFIFRDYNWIFNTSFWSFFSYSLLTPILMSAFLQAYQIHILVDYFRYVKHAWCVIFQLLCFIFCFSVGSCSRGHVSSCIMGFRQQTSNPLKWFHSEEVLWDVSSLRESLYCQVFQSAANSQRL